MCSSDLAKLFKLFRQLRPAIVHSRNLAALEVQLPAWRPARRYAFTVNMAGMWAT